MPSLCEDVFLLAAGLIALAVLLSLVLLGGATLKARAIVQAAERDADAIRARARADALELHREVIALWKRAERVLLGPQ